MRAPVTRLPESESVVSSQSRPRDLNFTVYSQQRGQGFLGLLGIKYPMYRSIVRGPSSNPFALNTATFFVSDWKYSYVAAADAAKEFINQHVSSGAI